MTTEQSERRDPEADRRFVEDAAKELAEIIRPGEGWGIWADWLYAVTMPLRNENADLRERLERAEADAARYRWLRPRLLCVDFAYDAGGDSKEVVVVFSWPLAIRVGPDADNSIDAARAAAPDGQASS